MTNTELVVIGEGGAIVYGRDGFRAATAIDRQEVPGLDFFADRNGGIVLPDLAATHEFVMETRERIHGQSKALGAQALGGAL
jgi:hypothetical protein